MQVVASIRCSFVTSTVVDAAAWADLLTRKLPINLNFKEAIRRNVASSLGRKYWSKLNNHLNKLEKIDGLIIRTHIIDHYLPIIDSINHSNVGLLHCSLNEVVG